MWGFRGGNRLTQLQPVEQKKAEKGELGNIVDSVILHHAKLFEIEGFDIKEANENHAKLYNPEKDEKREVYSVDNVILGLRDHALNGALRGRSLTSYFIFQDSKIKKLYTSQFNYDGYGNAIASSNLALVKLARFVQGGCSDFDSDEGVRRDGNGFHIEADGKSVYFHDNYIHLRDNELLMFMPFHEPYRPEVSLFIETIDLVAKSSLPEVAKHKISIVLMKNKFSFEDAYKGKLWSA